MMKGKYSAMTGRLGLPRLAVALLLLLTVMPEVALAAELTVCETGPPDCQYASIQDAVDAASTGDVIKVAEGTYAGVQKRGHLVQVVYLDKTVTLRGGYTAPDYAEPPDPEANPTTLDAQGQGRVLYIARDIEPTIEGLRITGGNAAGLGGGGWGEDGGGGIYVDRAKATISGNAVFGNSAGEGGGLFLHTSEATLSGNTITGNYAANFGGGGVFLFKSPATLYENAITGNTSDYVGGGVLLHGSAAALSGNTISGNVANGWGGGGVFLAESAAMLSGNDVSDNTANDGGGGGLLLAQSPATLRNNIINTNHANDGGGLALSDSYGAKLESNIISNNTAGWGGGLNLYESDATLSGNHINSNIADYNGGGLHIGNSDATLIGNTVTGNSAESGGGLMVWESAATLSGNTITGNVAAAEGGGLLLGGSEDATVRDNTISGNEAHGWGGGGVFLNNSASTLKGNNISGNEANEGGGLLVWQSSATLKDNIIDTNHANGGGGGLQLNESDNATVKGNIISSNTAPFGGGLDVSYSDATLISNTITLNSAEYGGGLNVVDSDATLTENAITDNTATEQGGGLYLNGSNNAKVSGNTVSDNEAHGWGGGGVFLNNSAATLKGNNISSNEANEGGGLLVWQSPATLKNNIIESNHANGGGGGLQLNESDNATVSDNTISDNTATHNGGGLTLWQSPATISGNIVSGNSADWGGGLNVTESDATLTANTIIDNTATEQGGGLLVNGSGAMLRDNTISGNAANEGGGVILWQSPATLSGNTVSGNIASGVGGGLRLGDCDNATVSGNNVFGNEADSGGGLFIGGSDTATFNDNTITGNVATGWGGGGVFMADDSAATLQGNTISENTAGEGGGVLLWQSPATLTENTIRNNSADWGGGLNLNESDATLSGNDISANSAINNGGGLQLGSSAAILEGNTILGNTATNDGGGLVLRGSAATLTGNTINGNSAEYGGGLDLWQSPAMFAENSISENTATYYGGGLNLNESDATLTGNTVTGNTTNEGGGLLLSNSDATLDDNTISGNSAGSGGGIGLQNSSSAIIRYAVIASNTAQEFGGGISMRDGSSVTIHGAQIYANVALHDQGGGISADGGDVHLDSSWVVGNLAENNEGGGISVGGGGSFYGENCVIAGNYAGTSAGGLWLYQGGSFHLVNCDIVGNDTASEGGALATAYGSQIELTNTLIIGNGGNTGIADRDGSGSVILLNYCDTYANSPDGMNGVTITRNDCLGTPSENGLDPLMSGGALPGGVGPAFAGEWLSYDYRLQADSPAIDAGTPTGAPATDIEGTPRDATPDLGAYESASGVRINPPSQTNSGARGEVVAHEATVFNGTGASDSFDLTLGGHAWDASLSADRLGPIAHGESAAFTLYVTVPADADWYSTDTVVVSATSVASPKAYFDTATFTTQAYAPPQISVSPDALASTQNVGEVAIETLTIGNGNGVPLEFEVVPQGGLPVQEGLVSWWPGEGDAADMADGNGGTLEGGTGFAAGKVGQAFSFDGMDDRVNVGNAANLHLSADGFTIVAWVKFDSDDPWPTGDDMSIADKMSDIGLNGDGWRLFRQRDFGNLLFCLGGGGDNGCDHWAPTPPTTVMATTIAQKDVWYHVAGVLSSSDISIYVNGVLEDSKPRPAFSDSNSTDLLIGANAPEGAYLDGLVDEVALFNRALTEAEIQALYNWQGGSDAPWLSTDPTAGTVTANSSVPVEVILDASDLQPDIYATQIVVQSNDPVAPSISIPVSMTVGPTASMGWIEGTVTDARTGNPLEATIVALEQPSTITTDPDTGAYTFWLDEGSHTLQVTAGGYVTETVAVEITAQQGTTQDFALMLNVPVLQVSPESLHVTHQSGDVTIRTLTISNNGPAALTFDLVEPGMPPVVEGVVAYYPFNGNASDESGNGNDGTVEGATLTVDRFGNPDSAYSFDGNSDYISRPYDATSGLFPIEDPFTISAWFKTSASSPEEQVIVSSHYAYAGDGYLLTIDSFNASRIRCFFSIYNQDVPVYSTDSVNDGHWHHIVCMWKDDVVYLYLDAELQDSTSAVGTVAYANQAPFKIGHTDAAGSDSRYYFNGSIDDVTILNRAMTEAEVQELYHWQGDGDVPWLSTAPTSGIVPAKSSMPVEVTLDASGLQPQTSATQLVIRSNDPITPSVTVPVTMTVEPTANMGWVEGTVTDAGTADPLEATIVALGQPYTITTDPDTGAFTLWLDEGSHTLQATARGYVTETVAVEITAQQGTTQNFALVPKPPTVWYVTPSGDDGNDCLSPAAPCATINGTLAKPGFVSGDTILLATGTYTGSGDQVVRLNKDVTLTGGWDEAFTTQSGTSTIDGEGARRGIAVNGGVTALVDRFTVQNGYTGDGNGGGIHNSGTLSLTHCTIDSNFAYYDGYFGHGGGGIYNVGVLTLISSTVSNNTATDGGGGIYATNDSSTVIEDSKIFANTANNWEGGGVQVHQDSDLSISGSWVVGNAALGNDAGGIGSNSADSAYIENSIIAGNFAGGTGGGLWGGSGYRVVNSHIIGNEANGDGAAIAINSAQIEITNTLIISNTGNTGISDQWGSGAVFLLSYCDTYGNSPDGTGSVTITRTNCLGTPPEDGLDPLMAGGALPTGVGPAFASEWMSYDYRLQADSLAIDAGTPIDAPATDIEGTPRDATPDMGAYESRFE